MSLFKKYLMPGFVFQGILIAGGYGTGRELVEYFMQYGPLGGILGMFSVTFLVWGATLAVTFEVCRLFRVYDYRSFLLKLLGSGWILFEIIYLALMMVVLAVVGSAAGILLRDSFGIPYMAGVALMLVSVGVLAYRGSGLIEKFMSGWSMLIYIVYLVFMLAAYVKLGDSIRGQLSEGVVLEGWAAGAFKYALYCLGAVPAALFAVEHQTTRKEALTAGWLAGLIGILPALLLYMAMMGEYPAILSEEIPAAYVLAKIGIMPLLVAFQIVLFGTLIETGVGFVHSVNERIRSALTTRGRKFSDWQRPIVAIVLLSASMALSSFGLIDLIAMGYGSLSWGFFFLFVVPLMTVGIYKIIRAT